MLWKEPLSASGPDVQSPLPSTVTRPPLPGLTLIDDQITWWVAPSGVLLQAVERSPLFEISRASLRSRRSGGMPPLNQALTRASCASEHWKPSPRAVGSGQLIW